LFSTYQEASDRFRETDDRYQAAKQELAAAERENEAACRDLYDSIAELFETRPVCAASAKALLAFLVDSPYEFQEWVHAGGNVADLLDSIKEALSPLRLAA
jgi:hypothetical protein